MTDSQETACATPFERRTSALVIEMMVIGCLGVLPWFTAAFADYVPSFGFDMVLLIVMSVQVAVPTLYILWLTGEPLSQFGICRLRPLRDMTVGIVVCGLGWIIPLFIMIVIAPIVASIVSDTASDVSFEGPTTTIHFVLLPLAMIANSIAEELVMRGYFIVRLRQIGLSTVQAIVASTFLFAGYHLYQGVWGAIHVFFIGLVYAIAFVVVQRLWPVVIAHTLMNLIVYLQL